MILCSCLEETAFGNGMLANKPLFLAISFKVGFFPATVDQNEQPHVNHRQMPSHKLSCFELLSKVQPCGSVLHILAMT